ncbi:amidophosphoribosyltransferase [Paucilactobacillus vaccinostercus DSM 20634]|jgi:amidophosphoribosyltransferase|uniref:Amidophosphoribosyltransferase n=1 Tax=Paucilactobacillus vaccinostercus DSM 20634 TaxID=1423813 RepID=A0A0R2AD14_9LACO|nr:amidophosphoribosyltransferase [Paucilactobacillus vaccinostercus]KRM61657.1 amidophosphoribosyltransferase [Paucilactobacillus vaccinostercus DSM 20634]RRG10674.1 MAG: amidophosphoribosyltransferase [Lactobacillus sp.]
MATELKSLNEECGVFGVWNDDQAAQRTYFGLHSLQHRGQEGAGIVVKTDEDRLIGHKGLGLLADVFDRPESIDELQGRSAIGHVRYGTAGSRGIENIQPLLFHYLKEDVALAHNGNLTNAVSMREKLEADGAIFQSNSDTEVLMHLIQRQPQAQFVDRLKASLRQIKGGFAYLILTKDALYAALDPNGFRPLVVGQLESGSYIVASETCALDVVGAKFVRDVQPGELIQIDDSGYHVMQYTTETQLAICSMEYIYFARPDSDIYGVNVHMARQEMGRQVALENPIDADIVVGVPNSSLSAASGVAQQLGVPDEMGLIKNQYSSRTFIQPTQELREQGVKMKLSAVRAVVAGKKVALVDDSIVRGTTSQYIVRMLKAAGAKEVHLLIASPPLKYPCFYGIDIEHTRELMAANYTVEEMRDQIGADSLHFLSLPGLIKAIGLKQDAPNEGLCVAYFSGDYPTALYDYEAGFEAPKTADDHVLAASANQPTTI